MEVKTEELGVKYDVLYRRATGVFGRLDVLSEAASFVKSEDADLHALDIGSGEGQNAIFLAGLGFSVDAFDLSKVGVDRTVLEAKKRGIAKKISVMEASIFSATIARDYHFILASKVLHHFEPALRRVLFALMMQHTLPGGVIAIVAFEKKGEYYDHLVSNDAPDTSLEKFVEKNDIIHAFEVTEEWEVVRQFSRNSVTLQKRPGEGQLFSNFEAVVVARKKEGES